MMAEQPTSAKFSEVLPNGFDVVCTKSENGIQICRDYCDFFKKRAQIEEEYAKKLISLYKTVPGSGIFSKAPPITKETKTLREALTGILEKGIKGAEQHQDLANKTNDMCKNLDNWVKNKDTDRKKVIMEGQKHNKSVMDAKANVLRAKDFYERSMKELDQAKEALMKAEKDEVNQPENKKLQPITKKAAQKTAEMNDKAKKLEVAYQQSVTKTNEEIETYKKERMPIVLDQLQKWEQDRWNTLLTSIRTFKTIQEAIPPILENYTKEIGTLVEAANIDEDFKEFIDANKKESTVENVEFVAFKSKFTEIEQAKEQKAKEDKLKEKQDTASFSAQTAQEKLEADSKVNKKVEPANTEIENKKNSQQDEGAKQVKANMFPDDPLFQEEE